MSPASQINRLSRPHLEHTRYDANDRLTFEYLDSDNNGSTDQTTEYGWDATQQTSKTVTDAQSQTLSRQAFGYNLQGRMSSVVNEGYTSGTLSSRERTSYEYDSKSYRVETTAETDAALDGNYTLESRTEFLADHHNHTGYTQTIRETTYDDAGNVTKQIDYTFGHDEISQTVTEFNADGTVASTTTHVFGHDGHGSVRVLYDLAGAATRIAQAFTFAAYGETLAVHGANGVAVPVTAALTSLGYSGEHFDAKMQQQYLRARWYDPANGRFNRLDPFAGKMQDPQSLHKYAYVHGDPIQGVDPTGLYGGLGSTIGGFAVAGAIGGALLGGIDAALDPNATSKDIYIGAIKGLFAGFFLGAFSGVLIATIPLLATASAAGALTWAAAFTSLTAMSGVLTAIGAQDSLRNQNNSQATFRIMTGVLGIMLLKGGLATPRVGVSRVATEPDTAFFWSGRTNGRGGAEVALEIARESGGTTLEGLIESRSIRMPAWDSNNPAAIAAWAQISAEYAAGVSGNVRAVVGRNLRPNNIWENVELPALMENPRVTRITTIDPATQVETVVFER